jgi:hypothetical protein
MTNSASCANSTLSSSSSSAITVMSVCPCSSDYTVSIFTGTVLVGVDYVQFPITSTAALSVNVSSVNPVNCTGCCNGSAYVTWSGGNTQINSPTMAINGMTVASYTPATGLCQGSHTVCATDASGCTACSVFSVGFQTATSIAENQTATEIALFPNPALSEITLTLNTENTSVITVYDLQGRTIIHREIVGSSVKLDIGDLDNGIYLLEVSDSQHHPPLRKKFIKTAF